VDLAWFWLDTGVALMGEHALDNALAAFERATLLDPHCADAHFQKGLVLAQLGHEKEAHEAFARSVELKPEFEEAAAEVEEGASSGRFEIASPASERRPLAGLQVLSERQVRSRSA